MFVIFYGVSFMTWNSTKKLDALNLLIIECFILFYESLLLLLKKREKKLGIITGNPLGLTEMEEAYMFTRSYLNKAF